MAKPLAVEIKVTGWSAYRDLMKQVEAQLRTAAAQVQYVQYTSNNTAAPLTKRDMKALSEVSRRPRRRKKPVRRRVSAPKPLRAIE